jgi:hypothetical protein
MKTIIKSTGFGLLFILLLTGNVFSQELLKAPAKGTGKGMLNLSDKQKEMLKLRAEKVKTFRAEFKSLISQKQKDILGDPRVMPAERMKAFRASLTDQQVAMIKSHREEMKNMRLEFRATLTPEQETIIKRNSLFRRRMNSPQNMNKGLQFDV